MKTKFAKIKTIVSQTVQALKNEWNAAIHNPAQQKFSIVLVMVALALVAVQVDISRQIDTDSLIRIHVLGNSNSEQDQMLKLKVKDAVVAYLAPQLEKSQSLNESRCIIQNNMTQITQIANETLLQQGSTDTVTLQYGHFDFPIKYYGSFSLPAGNYEALRILIGEAEGRNWWCVLFPPLCFTDSNMIDASTKSSAELSEKSLAESSEETSAEASEKPLEETTPKETGTPSGKYTDDMPEQKIVIKWKGKEILERWLEA